MLQNIRDNSQGLVAKIIVGFVILTFALFGVDAIVSYQGSSHVAEVDDAEISKLALDQAMYLQKRQLAERMGDKFDPSSLDEAQIRKSAMDALIKQQVMLNRAADEDMAIAPGIVNSQIMENPNFQQNGEFSNEVFSAILRSSGFTPQMFKQLLSQELTNAQLFNGIQGSEFVTEKDMELMASFSNQTRDISFIELSLADYLPKQLITDEEISASYEKNKHQYMTPESVKVDYLVLKMAQFYPQIDDADIKAAYELEKNAALLNVNKKISHILLNTSEQSADEARQALMKIQEQLKAGGDFADIAKQQSQDLGSKAMGGDLGFANLSSLPAAMADAVKQLGLNEISEIVETDSGLHLIKVTEVEEPNIEAYDDAKARIQLSLQKQQAESIYIAKVEQLGDITYTSDGLSEAAKAFDIEIQSSPLFSRGNAEGILADKKVLQAAFDEELYKNKQNSEVIELADDTALVLNIRELNAPQVKPLDEVRDVIVAKLKQKKATAAMRAEASELINEIKAGKSLAELAQKAGASSKQLKTVNRQQPDVDRQVLLKAFSLPAVKDQTLVAETSDNQGNIVILTVSNTQNGQLGEAEKAQSALMQRFLARSNGAQVLTRFGDYLEANSDIEIR